MYMGHISIWDQRQSGSRALYIIPSWAKELGVGVWDFKQRGKQFTGSCEKQMFDKQKFAMPCQ